MITIIHIKKHHKITLEGHADYDEYGKDIVCSAATMLFHTLCAKLWYEEENGKVSVNTVIHSGYLSLECSRIVDDKIIDTVFDTICSGYKLLETSYLNNVKYIEL